VLIVPINLETTSGHEAQHARLSSSTRLLNETPDITFHSVVLLNCSLTREARRQIPLKCKYPLPPHCSNKSVNAPRKQRQPKTRPAEASVRGGIHLIISSLETNRSFELQILSFSSESLMGLNGLILLALQLTCPLEHLVTKIGRFRSDTNKQGIKRRGNEKIPRNWGSTVGARLQVPKPLQTFQPR
jgi:hypothetical protein